MSISDSGHLLLLLYFPDGDVTREKRSQQSLPVKWDQPLYSVSLLHQRRLVHGPDPAIHVLLCVRTEEICPHPAVFRLRANHRVPIVNVGAHSCMGRLSKRGGDRERQGSAGSGGQRAGGNSFCFLFFFCRGQEKAARDAEEWGKNFAFLFLRRPTAFRWMRTKFATAVVVVEGGGRREVGGAGRGRAAARTNVTIVLRVFFVLFFCRKITSTKQVNATQRNSDERH